MSLHADVADAVQAALDGETWSQTIAPLRKWRCRYKAEELTQLRVTVLPGPSQHTALTRQRDDERYMVDVVVQQQFEEDADVDELVKLAEEFRAYFRRKSVTAGTRKAVCIDPREFISPDKAGIARELLENERIFSCVLRLTWRVIGAP